MSELLIELYKIAASLLLALGLGVVFSSRSLVKMMLGIEVMFNGSLLYLILIGTIYPYASAIFSLLSILIASAELLIAVSIVILYFRTHGEAEARGEIPEEAR
ncbi:MAG: NADH-quinone oxidoreductase subunit K [Fervidicoccaceae archaeon]